MLVLVLVLLFCCVVVVVGVCVCGGGWGWGGWCGRWGWWVVGVVGLLDCRWRAAHYEGDDTDVLR